MLVNLATVWRKNGALDYRMMQKYCWKVKPSE